ncbi:MAG: pyridoxal 5'-phosphate synthase glutaminase subunit PdxT [Rhodospirillales bacterium]|jgi:5'-phosphate synthase pdxT subunit|nr:pyridoxal 5'-phosphate synthase glutaminase subunit PdxT [Rhodospirillales bacterium]
MKIGVLALQGDFEEHLEVLRGLGATGRAVRLPRDLEDVDGLIIPGGESTTILKLLHNYRITASLRQRVNDGLPLMGTCAGLVVVARAVSKDSITPLDFIDITVRRNAFGRQRESFEANLTVAGLGEMPYHAIFIRAPMIERVGAGVEVMATLADGTIVAARQGSVMVAAFHPELTPDQRWHQHFLELIA